MATVYFTISNFLGQEASAFVAEYNEAEYANEQIIRTNFVEFVRNREPSCTLALNRRGGLIGLIADAGSDSEEKFLITESKPRSLKFTSSRKIYGYRRAR